MKLYVGNLSYGTTDADLETLFAEYGAIQSARVVIDRDTNRSKGFGFVEMDNAGEAKEAISALDGANFQNRTIKVNEARPREDRPRRDSRPPRRY